MTADIIDGKLFAERLRARVKSAAAHLAQEKGIIPGLAVILVGEDPASHVYVANKGRSALAAGLRSIERRLPADAPEAALLEEIRALNADPSVHGILVQLPLPKHINPDLVIETIDPAKDVDGFHPSNVAALMLGRPGMVPCTPLGCLMMLKARLGRMDGVKAVVLGRSRIVGAPMTQLLLRENATVTIAHSRTRDLPHEIRAADVLVAAVGRPEMVRGDWIKPGATVIDVGINRITGPEGKSRLVGDVHFESARAVAGAITPVPGGVGPMTIACLLVNAVAAAARINGIAPPEELGLTSS